MSCNNSPEGPVSVPVPSVALSEPYSQVSHGPTIQLKPGEPISSACERAGIIGSIPQIVRYPSFTMINGTVAAGQVSNGGIRNLRSFFTVRSGCYENDNVRLSSNCC